MSSRLIDVLKKVGISATPEIISLMIAKYPKLDWEIEAIHIYAWILHKKNWTQGNYIPKLDKWGTLSSKKGREQPYYSTATTFQRARKEIEGAPREEPAWVDASTPTAQEELLEPQGRQEFGKDSDEYQWMESNRIWIEEQDIDIDMLDMRLKKLCMWVHWINNTREQDDICYRHLQLAITKRWFDDEVLLAYIASQNYILWDFIDSMSQPPHKEEEEEEEEEQEEEQEEQEEETIDFLYMVVARIPPHRMPLLGYVLAEEADQITIWLSAPVAGKQIHTIKRATARVVDATP